MDDRRAWIVPVWAQGNDWDCFPLKWDPMDSIWTVLDELNDVGE